MAAERDTELLRRIEAAAIRAWPPEHMRSIEGWLLCIGGFATKRLRSARTLDLAPGADLDEAIGEVERRLAERGWPACFHITDIVTPGDLDARLAARGYERVSPTSVMLLDLVDPLPADSSIELHTRVTQPVMNAIADRLWSAEARAERVAIFGRIRRPHRFALAWVEGEPAAAGLCVRDGDLAGIFAMRTRERFRGRGLAGRVLSRLAGWARAEGAASIYLQVEDDNPPAQALYRRLGFRRLYGYHYRERDLR
ncbi:MAG TPA: GNAT family N-acetyltransferase [Geminicoccaceae bacterium]|nr:GNAT family N-acetyltransferase [Geminicoccus sp.]HMU51884.1 GNAT family N-acetyltransferase [Geminicoccaceae bacterium]